MASRRPTEPRDPNPAAPAPTPARAKSSAPSSTSRKTPKKPSAPLTVSEDIRRAMIAEAAYLRAVRRGFMPGGVEGVWLAAEAEVDALLKARAGATSQ